MLYAFSKNVKIIIMSIILIFLTSMSSTSFSTPSISRPSAIYTICHLIFASPSMTLSLLFEEWALSLDVAAFDTSCLLVIFSNICKSAGGACFRDSGPVGKYDPGGL